MVSNKVKVMKPTQNSLCKHLLIKVNQVYKRIGLGDIYYFESDGKYITINVDSRDYSIRNTLKNLEDMLSLDFIRVHASYIVNTSKIKNINQTKGTLTLTNEKEIAFSRTYKELLFDQFIIG